MYKPLEKNNCYSKCEITIPITLKLVICLKPEILVMPTTCHASVSEQLDSNNAAVKNSEVSTDLPTLQLRENCRRVDLESESDVNSMFQQNDEEISQSSVQADVKQNSYLDFSGESGGMINQVKTFSEADWLVATKEQIWQYLREELNLFSHYLTGLREPKKGGN